MLARNSGNSPDDSSAFERRGEKGRALADFPRQRPVYAWVLSDCGPGSDGLRLGAQLTQSRVCGAPYRTVNSGK
jgi:hypothetical protein